MGDLHPYLIIAGCAGNRAGKLRSGGALDAGIVCACQAPEKKNAPEQGHYASLVQLA